MYIPPKIQFYSNSNCQFNCEFCVKTDLPNDFKVNMDMSNFKKYADKCIDYGIKTFELTPIVGEPLLDKTLLQKIEYLSPHSDYIMAFTNLIGLNDEMIKELDRFPNFYLYLSIYGNTLEIFEQRTGMNARHFKDFEQKYSHLAKHILTRKTRGFNIGEINYRFKPNVSRKKNSNKIDTITNYLEVTNKCSEVYVFDVDYNWKELYNVKETLEEKATKRNVKGVCRNLIQDIGIWDNGDLGICSGWFDINKKMILGNLNETSLKEIFKKDGIYHTIYKEQNKGLYRSLCEHCNYIIENKYPFIEKEEKNEK
jgi:sulfatase maturation enzyme AslB (radical SAM superfamily)